MAIDSERLKVLPILARSTPATVIIILVTNLILNPSMNAMYLLLMYVGNMFLNYGLKFLFSKTLYSNKKTSLSFLGTGTRPTGASLCGISLNSTKKEASFGMPSGHSQLIWATVIYLICKVTNKYVNNEVNNTVLSILWLIFAYVLLFGVGIYVSYSRVAIEGCHTVQQVIVGGLVGTIYGLITFLIELKAF